jgi:hypothetical protein
MPTPFENPIALVRTLKGAPLSVLFALFFANQPVGEKWLVEVTGYSVITVRRGLEYLAEIRLVQRNGRYSAWILSGQARQLVLTPNLLQDPPLSNPEPGALAPPHQPGLEPARRGLNFNPPPTTATATIEETDKSSSSSSKESNQRLNFNPRVLETLHAAGIGEPTASRLAALPHITNEYAQAHIKKAKEDKIATGLLIHRMKYHDPQPETLDHTHLLMQSWGICPRCHRSPCNCAELAVQDPCLSRMRMKRRITKWRKIKWKKLKRKKKIF